MKKLNFQTDVLVPSQDPSLTRCFKQHPIVLDGAIVGYNSAKFTPDVMPSPDDVEPSDSDNLLDFGIYTSVQREGDSVNMSILPNMSDMEFVDTFKDVKSNL